jgi:hypothetical protein
VCTVMSFVYRGSMRIAYVQGENYTMSRIITYILHAMLLTYGVFNLGLEGTRKHFMGYVKLSIYIYIYTIYINWWPGARVRFPEIPDFVRSSGFGTGSTQLREYN